MKKLYFLLVAIMVTGLSYGQDLILTGAYDGPLTGGTPKGIELYVINDIADLSIYGVGSANNGDGTDGEEFTFPADTATAGDFIYVAMEDTEFLNFFGFSPNYITSAMGINGDDAVELFMNGSVIDVFGDIDVDGTNEPWDHLDGWAYRVSSTGPDGAMFTLANWTFSGTNQLEGGTTNATCTVPFPIGTFTYTTSSDPSLTITSPTEGQILPESASTTMDITFSVQNFVVATAGNGDGHLLYSVDSGNNVMKFDTNPITLTGLALGDHTIYMELVDDSDNPLDPAVNKTVNFSIAILCDLSLTASWSDCDAFTAGTDTYTANFNFSGGNTGTTYTITVNSGTIGGDDPSSVASGTITVTGASEGTDTTISVIGGACDLGLTEPSPACDPGLALPLYESFNYTVGTDLTTNSSYWNNISTSTDEILIASGNLSYAGLPASQGEMVSFDGVGSDSDLYYGPIASGEVFASFIFKVTDQSTITDLTDGGYFALLGNFDARLWVKPNPDASGTTFDIGFGNMSSSPPVTSTLYNVGDEIFIVMSYDIATGTVNAWVNPDAADFGGVAPAVTLTGTDASPATSLSQFVLRQDSTGETPFILFDELRIGTTWEHVTPTDNLAVSQNEINGFGLFPNPVTNGMLTINTQDNLEKNIQIFDILGKQVFTQTTSATTINIANLNSGIYIIRVEEAGRLATRKLVIE